MRRLALVLVVLGTGCRGEAVEPVVADSGAFDSATSDAMLEDSSLIDSGAPDADSSATDSSATDAALVPFEAAGNDVECGATRGARMVYVPVAPTFCIDAHEVSNTEYRAFLSATDKPVEKDFCDWNAGAYGSLTGTPADSMPVAFVDYCDAYAYCAWAGKRLCGGRDKEIGLSDSYGESQWTVACVNGPAGTPWSVGNSAPAAGVCRVDMSSAGAAAVGSLASCKGTVSPYDRVFDLTGNVEEWDNSGCKFRGAGTTADDRLTIQCGRRGGSYAHTTDNSRCVTFGSAPIDNKRANLGFRCCKGPL